MMTSGTYNEMQLLYDLRHGSASAFEYIFQCHWKRLYNIARTKVLTNAEAEDIVQGIFSTLWEKREHLLITDLNAYLNTALRNRILNLIRSRITQEKYWDHYKNFFPSHADNTHQDILYNDLKEAVDEFVNHLPIKSQQVFRLSRVEGRSNAEIANLLNLSEKSIEYHLTKCLRELRVHLKDYTLLLAIIAATQKFI